MRMALGASRRDVLRLVLSQAFSLTGLGLALGLPIAAGLSQAMVARRSAGALRYE